MKRITLLLTLWLALCGFTKIQDQAVSILTSSGTTTASTTLSGVAARNTILGCAHSGIGTFSVSDNNGGSYTIIGQTTNGMWIFMAPNHAAGNTTITGSNGGTTGSFLSMVTSEVNGLGLAPTFDTNGGVGTYAARTVIQTGTLNPSTNGNEFVFGCGFTDTVQTPSSLINYGTGGGTPTALTNQGQTSSGGGETIVGAYQPVASTGQFGFQWTTTTGGTLGYVAAILPSATPTLAGSICPNGAGQVGPCDLGADTWSNITTYYVCPASTSCTMVVTDAASCPAAGSTPTGGSPGHPCSIAWTGSAWVTD